jgi:AFG3 family protein
MVKVFGLNDKIGNVSYYDSRGAESFQNPYSEATAQVIDEEVSKIIEGQFERAKNILTENREKLDRLAKKLLEKEVIFKEDLEDIFGKSNFHKDEVQLIHQNDEEVKVLEENTPEQAPEQENG